MGDPQRAIRPVSAPVKAHVWRDTRVLRIVLQVLFLLALGAVARILYTNMTSGLERLGLSISFSFLDDEAGFGISEGISYQLGDTYARAALVGLVNSVRVVVFGVIMATVVGFLAGLARLSGNWLIRKIAGVYVETLRNTPLLLQLMFWYTAVILKLPPVRQSINLYESIFINQRGVYLPRPFATDMFQTWGYLLLAALGLAVIVFVWRRQQLKRTDRPGFPIVWAGIGFVVLAVLTWFVVPTAPLAMDVPVLQGFNFRGGLMLSPEFAAILLGLTMYTGAFIAEVVRGGVQSVSRGQREAAMAVGLSPGQVTYLVIIPQALRAILPPLTSQYLNLFKNSSLAIAVGFPDLFSVGNTVLNQTGQSIPVFILLMAVYLAMSLIASLFMNWYNHRIRLIER